MATNFKKYPKVMIHPEHTPAVLEKWEGKGLFKSGGRQISPARYPNETVFNQDQEARLAAKGYRPNGISDAAEYERTILESTVNLEAVGAAYPKWKYSAVEMPVIVQSAAEERALGDGWEDAPIIATEDDLIATSFQSAKPEVEDSDEQEEDERPAPKIDKRSKEYRQAVGR